MSLCHNTSKAKTRQRLSDLVDSAEYPPEEKQRIVRILEQSKPKYMLTIEKLGMVWVIPFIN